MLQNTMDVPYVIVHSGPQVHDDDALQAALDSWERRMKRSQWNMVNKADLTRAVEAQIRVLLASNVLKDPKHEVKATLCIPFEYVNVKVKFVVQNEITPFLDVPNVIIRLSDDDPLNAALATWKEQLNQMTSLDDKVKVDLTRIVEAYLLSQSHLAVRSPLRLPYATVSFVVIKE
jgi:hypothetical protein